MTGPDPNPYRCPKEHHLALTLSHLGSAAVVHGVLLQRLPRWGEDQDVTLQNAPHGELLESGPRRKPHA